MAGLPVVAGSSLILKMFVVFFCGFWEFFGGLGGWVSLFSQICWGEPGGVGLSEIGSFCWRLLGFPLVFLGFP